MKKIFLFLLFCGILTRFIIQFIYPTFNVDEMALGNNIKHSNFLELLHPLKYYQSCPPLLLWLQKLIITVSPLRFWVSIKLLSFSSSCIALILFYLLIAKYNFRPIFLLLFAILLFNPFVIGNSLTVKQYTIDLTGVLLLIMVNEKNWFKKYKWLYFMLWCLISNIGLFAFAGYLVYDFTNQREKITIYKIIEYAKKNILFLASPLPYILYFIWFMKQPGAAELKIFMTDYWQGSFIPLNGGIFKYLVYEIHGLWAFMYNRVNAWGIFLMAMLIPLFIMAKKTEYLFKKEIRLLVFILSAHLFLNLLHLYPFSDRLYLYLSPLFILMLGASVTILLQKTYKTAYTKVEFAIAIPLSIISLALYISYFTLGNNDIYVLYDKLDGLKSKNTYITKTAKDCINEFDDFTDYAFTRDRKFILLDEKLDSAKYIVSRSAMPKKMNETAKELVLMQELEKENKIHKVATLNAYNIYVIKK